jgi:hypothetical protein
MTFEVLTLLPVSKIQLDKPQRRTSNASQPVVENHWMQRAKKKKRKKKEKNDLESNFVFFFGQQGFSPKKKTKN